MTTGPITSPVDPNSLERPNWNRAVDTLMSAAATAPVTRGRRLGDAEDPLEFMGWKVVVIDGWPEDVVAVMSPALAGAIKAAIIAAQRTDERIDG